MTSKLFRYIAVTVAIIALTSSCNKKDNETVDYKTTSYSSTQIQAFNLIADETVLANLDSVFFTIDLDRCEIFNADSLPYGTDISALKVNITFPTVLSEAEISVTGAKYHNDTTFSYTSTTTAIDFTGNVNFRVTSYDENVTRNYSIKVNVHQLEPDSLYWNPDATQQLPYSAQNRLAQSETLLYSLAKYNSDYYLSTKHLDDIDDPDTWAGQRVAFASGAPSGLNINSFVIADDTPYVLDNDGHLYVMTTEPIFTKVSTVPAIYSILGTYDDKLLCVFKDGDSFFLYEYTPSNGGVMLDEVPAGFPVSDASPMVYTNTKWATGKQGIIAGGLLADGNASPNVWGYDGNSWGQINDPKYDGMPALVAPVIFPYTSFDTNTVNFSSVEHPTWFVLGGRLKNGEMNDSVYVSRDNGILWLTGADNVQLPSYLTRTSHSQAFIVNKTLHSNRYYAPRRVSSAITEWECPFIYLAGGKDKDGTWQNTLWRGVLNRLSFQPIF